jgi:pimeloyl-ACP methyl ester carboxylesterase
VRAVGKGALWGAALGLLAATAYVCGRPPEAPSTPQQFEAAQAKLFAAYNVNPVAHYLPLRAPPVRVHYLELGQGEPMILIHGEHAFAADWTPLAAGLAQRYRIILPDLPGCGLSGGWDYRGTPVRDHAVAFVRSLLDQLHIEKARLGGSSTGAYYVLAFALACPERVEKIAILGAGPLMNDYLPAYRRALSVPGLNRWLTAAHRGDLDQIGARLPGAGESRLSWMESIGGPFGFNPRFSIKNELHLVRAPALLIQGADDRLSSASGFDAIPNSRIIVLPGAADLPWYTATERCKSELLQFLR